MSAISRVLGMFLKAIYDGLASTMATEPKNISFFALSIIIATLIIKILVLPLNFSAMKNQKKMAKLQPELKKLQQKYKNDPQTLAAKQQQLYKDSNTNMLGGCLPMILQLVILLAFYRVFLFPTKFAFTDANMYEAMNKNFFYIKNLDHVDQTMIMPIIAAVTTLLMQLISMKNPATQGAGADQAQGMMKGMMVVMPLMIFSMGRKFAAGLVLYWTVSNLFAMIQQFITNKVVERDMEE